MTIQNKRDHDLIIEIHTDVRYLRERIDEHNSKFDDVNKCIEKVELRIDKLEGWKQYIQGAIAIVGIIASTAYAKIVKLL